MRKVTTLALQAMKEQGERIAMLTAYDYPMSVALDKAGIDIMLVGDSMGNVVYGYKNTLPVTIEDILRHTQAVVRGAKRAMVIADMPFMSFALPEDAVRNAGRFIKEGRADAVKLEGGRERVESIKLMVDCGIAVMGHVGLTPQYYHQLGGFRVQGKSGGAATKILEDALALEEAGVFAIVLETVPWKIAKEITERVKVPTIGIGAGPHCDGQVLVSQDMMGFFESTPFTFLKQYANVYETMINSTKEYIQEVKDQSFPTPDHSYKIPEEEFEKFMKKIAEQDD